MRGFPYIKVTMWSPTYLGQPSRTIHDGNTWASVAIKKYYFN